MKIDCSCTVVAGAIQYCEAHKAAFAMLSDLSTIVSAPKGGIPQEQMDKLNPLAPLFADLQGPEACSVEIQDGRNVILFCPAHQAAYSLASRLIDLSDGSKLGLTPMITSALTSMAPALDPARFK